MRGRSLFLVLCCALLPTGMAAVGAAPPAAAGSTARPALDPSVPAAERAAAIRARADGRRVEVLTRRSETEQVFANPDGSFTSTIAARPSGCTGRTAPG
jgi:hypothetical protein